MLIILVTYSSSIAAAVDCFATGLPLSSVLRTLDIVTSFQRKW
jgi:hypothetical protein